MLTSLKLYVVIVFRDMLMCTFALYMTCTHNRISQRQEHAETRFL